MSALLRGRRAARHRSANDAGNRIEIGVDGRQRRNTELGLIVLVVLIISVAYTLASLGRRTAIPANVGPFLGVLVGLLLVAHIANRRLAPSADALLLPLAALLNGVGYVVIARLNDQFAAKQAGWTAVGIGAYVATLLFVREVRSLRRLAFTMGLAGVVLLLLPMVRGLGKDVNGARIWIEVGPFTVQPGEFAKLAFAIFFAAYLVDRREILRQATFKLGPFHTPDPRHLLPVLIAWGFALIIMVFQKDLGSALLFFLLFVVLLWVATGRAAYPLVGLAGFGAAAYGAWTQFPHVQSRVEGWLDPWQDPLGRCCGQVVQGTFSLAWGGVAGTGLGLGNPAKVPYAETDFIFTAVGEELGLLGSTAVLAAFLLIFGSGLRIAATARDPFYKLLAAGLSTLIALQAFVIIGGILRVMPLTGVTLPFVSYGGSSLISNYILIALLVRMSDESATVRRSALSGRASG
jgi:peptidoglycan glycosyltransferase